MFSMKWKISTFCILLLSGTANAGIVKAINFEAETTDSAPSESITDTGKINSILFGTPTIKEETSGNKYLYFDQEGTNTYDQIYVNTFSDINTQRFSFDMFIIDSADGSNAVRLFFDTPSIQRYVFSDDGKIGVYNVDTNSRYTDAATGKVQYSNIYTAEHDVSSLFDLTMWHNYLFEIDYINQLVDIYIDSTKVFSDTIFLQYGGSTGNTIRITTEDSRSKFGIDNINLSNNSISVDEPPLILLLGLTLLGMSYYRKNNTMRDAIEAA